MSKKIRNSNVSSAILSSNVSESNVAVLEAVSELLPNSALTVSDVSDLLETIAPAVEVSDVSPVEATGENTLPVSVLSAKDSLGFGRGTETAFIAASLLSGTFTRKTLEANFLARFVPDANEGETKRKKTTFSVFLSDVKRPIGTYHASRGLVIRVSDSGILSVTSDSLAAAEKAIAAGILVSLKGITPKKYTVYTRILGEYGLTPEPKKA